MICIKRADRVLVWHPVVLGRISLGMYEKTQAITYYFHQPQTVFCRK